MTSADIKEYLKLVDKKNELLDKECEYQKLIYVIQEQINESRKQQNKFRNLIKFNDEKEALEIIYNNIKNNSNFKKTAQKITFNRGRLIVTLKTEYRTFSLFKYGDDIRDMLPISINIKGLDYTVNTYGYQKFEVKIAKSALITK